MSVRYPVVAALWLTLRIARCTECVHTAYKPLLEQLGLLGE